MFKSSSRSANSAEINVTLVDKSHVTMLLFAFIIITFISLKAQWDNQKRIERDAILRCTQRIKLEALVKKETEQLSAIDARYLAQLAPIWVRERHLSLVEYTAARRKLGEEQCQSPQ